jgi:hypothetical protein
MSSKHTPTQSCASASFFVPAGHCCCRFCDALRMWIYRLDVALVAYCRPWSDFLHFVVLVFNLDVMFSCLSAQHVLSFFFAAAEYLVGIPVVTELRDDI